MLKNNVTRFVTLNKYFWGLFEWKEILVLRRCICHLSDIKISKMEVDGNYIVITWDLNTTGRRLADEICHIGAYIKSGEEESCFSQYIMPHKNPDPGAVKRHHVRVANSGRFRVLMDTETGTYLKTKSEYTALHEFMDWLKSSSANTDGVILVYHETARYILVPLLLDALNKYGFIPRFKEIVKGFSNGVSIVDAYGDKEKITSNSLRSLSKTVLNDTNPETTSTLDRSSVLYKILTHVSEHKEMSLEKAVSSVASTIENEEEKLNSLRNMLNIQNTLRPIFQSFLMQKQVRSSASESIYKEEDNDAEKVSTSLKKRIEEKADEKSKCQTKKYDTKNNVAKIPDETASSPESANTTTNTNEGDSVNDNSTNNDTDVSAVPQTNA
ncbi:EXU [Lepeophtheirus salmonis]|uniref:EXU n=1 Tax=Lepeophtheirus salmonis TaxID=72036 RepID=A0A7R8H8S3_LEPSM|nr:EXU [Lepeophtheirus salmonis]CAF2927945.1 EXU [Lepeophtheirus salmonis]